MKTRKPDRVLVPGGGRGDSVGPDGVGDAGLRPEVRLQLHDVPLGRAAPERLRPAVPDERLPLPGRENEEKTVLETPAPVAFRTSAGYSMSTATTWPRPIRRGQRKRLPAQRAGPALRRPPGTAHRLLHGLRAADHRRARGRRAGGDAGDGERGAERSRRHLAQRARGAVRARLRAVQRQAAAHRVAVRGLRCRLPGRPGPLGDPDRHRVERLRSAAVPVRRGLGRRLRHQRSPTIPPPTCTSGPPT